MTTKRQNGQFVWLVLIDSICSMNETIRAFCNAICASILFPIYIENTAIESSNLEKLTRAFDLAPNLCRHTFVHVSTISFPIQM